MYVPVAGFPRSPGGALGLEPPGSAGIAGEASSTMKDQAPDTHGLN